jgi:hypothetical protein
VAVFNDTGDNGNDCQNDLPFVLHQASFPSDSPNGFGVGATNLQVTAGAYKSESWWDWGSDVAGAGGYGVSGVFARPAFQNGFTSSTFRSVPDVSANGDPDTGIRICVEVLGGPYRCTGGHMGALYGGTSLSTPEWAAGVAVLEQILGPLGNFGPLLYGTYGAAGASGFHTTASMEHSTRGATNDFAHLGLGTYDLGALAAALSAGFTANAPSLSCASQSPVTGTSDSCTTTFSTQLPAGISILVQPAGPSGASVSGCTAAGGLSCGSLGTAGQALTCASPCAAGSSFTFQITSSNAGPILESLNLTPLGTATQVLNLKPNPPAAFVTPAPTPAANNAVAVAQDDTPSFSLGYCAPAVNAPPPGVPCIPLVLSGQQATGAAIQLCQAAYLTVASQQAWIAAALGNVGGFVSPLGSPGSTQRAAPAPRPAGRYCSKPDGSQVWVVLGAPIPESATC